MDGLMPTVPLTVDRIIDWARAELARLNAAGIPDRIFPMARCWGDLRCVDPAIDPSGRKPEGCYRGGPATANRPPSLGRANMLKTWLNMGSLKTSPARDSRTLRSMTRPRWRRGAPPRPADAPATRARSSISPAAATNGSN